VAVEFKGPSRACRRKLSSGGACVRGSDGAASEAREREWGKEGAKTVGGTRHVMCGAEGRGIGGRALQMGQTRSPRGGPCSRLPRSQRSTHAG